MFVEFCILGACEGERKKTAGVAECWVREREREALN